MGYRKWLIEKLGKHFSRKLLGNHEETYENIVIDRE